MPKTNKIIIQDYTTVTELIKFAHNNNKKIVVNRMGDDYSGIYYEVTIYE